MKKNQLFEIYLVSNTQNNKVYIGATSQGSAKRFKQHVWKSESGSNYSFHKAIREFGTDVFEVKTLEYVNTIDEAKEREKYWIIQYRSTNPKYGYNGDCGGDIMFHTEEAKVKISAIHKGKDMSSYYRAVLQYSKEGDFIQEYPSVTHACEFTKISRTSMLRALNKTLKTQSKVNPYVWFYKDEFETVPTKIDTSDMYCNKVYERKVSENFLKAGEKQRSRDNMFANTIVEQLDLQGKRIALFYSIAEASRQTGVSLRTIKEHCAGVYLNNKNIKNCTWRKIEDVANLTAEDLNVLHTQENVAMSKRAGNNTRKVALYNQDNELIKIFDTLEDASKLTNVDRSTVGKQLKRYGIRIIPNVGYLKFYKE